MAKTRVLVTVPNMGWIRIELIQVLLNCAADQRYDVRIHLPIAVPLENNQHRIINKMKEEEYDFWLSFDDDTAVMGNPLDLVELNKDIIGCPYPLFTDTGIKSVKHMHWAGYDKATGDDEGTFKEHRPMKGLQEVDAIGGGCFLIARRVFEGPVMSKGAFTRFTNEDGTVKMGNDMSFCKRAKDCGFKIFCHYDYPCAHIKEIDLAYVLMMVNAAATAGVSDADPTEDKEGRDRAAVKTPEQISLKLSGVI